MAVNPVPHDSQVRASSFATTMGWVVLLVVATLVVYWPALHGEMLIDNPDHIPRVGSRSLAGLARVWFDVGTTSQYFPLLHTAFWFESQLWGDAVLGYHLVNVLQHVLSACLIVAIMRRLAIPGAWFAAFIFALHPVCVESVAWMTEQKNTLSTLLYLAAGYVYLGYDRDRRASSYWMAFALFAGALLTKSITATLVPALWVVLWWKRGRLEWRRDVRPLLLWLVTGAAFGLFTAWYEQVYANARGASFDLSVVERGLIAGRAIVFYAHTMIWPANLMFINPRWEVNAAEAWQYVFPVVVTAVAIGLAWLARRWRGPLAAFLLYTGTLFPTLSFLNINWFNYSLVADHFQYLACISLIVSAAAGLTLLAKRLSASRSQIAGAVGGAALVVLLGALTWRQSGIYRNAETLYRDTLAKNPSAWLAHHNLGAVLLDRAGSIDEAVGHFLTVLELKPNHLNAHINLGRAFSRLPGRLPDAIEAYEGALRLKPDDPRVRSELGHALARTPGRTDEAVAVYRRALELDAREWEAHMGLGHLLAATPGKHADAILEYQAAARLRPDLAPIHSELAGALVAAGRIEEAIAAFENVVRLQPDNPEARYNLGSLLADIPGRVSEAVTHFEVAVRLTPDDPAVHNNLGLALMQLPGRRDDAIRHLRRVLELAPDSADGHFNLGRVLLETPADEREALRHFEAAAQLRPTWEAAQRMVSQLRGRVR